MMLLLLNLAFAGPAELAGLALDPGEEALGAALRAPDHHAEALQAALSDPDWRVRQGAALVLAWRDDPRTAEALATLPLTPTRAGVGRVEHPALGTPAARASLAARLMAVGAPQGERLGVAHALAVDPDTDALVLAGLISVEADPEVRAVLTWGWREQRDGDAARAGLALGLADASPQVRARAAEAAAYLAPSPALAGALRAATRDADAQVRARAARALGWQGVGAAWPELEALLADPAAEVRLQALSSLERLDAGRAAALPALGALQADPDPRVARLAGSLTPR